jgi:hypothetical protein
MLWPCFAVYLSQKTNYDENSKLTAWFCFGVDHGKLLKKINGHAAHQSGGYNSS